MPDIYEPYREKAKGTPFYSNGSMICRCGQVPLYVPASIWPDLNGVNATMICQNPKCGAYGLMFEVKLQRVEGKVVHNANF